MTYYDDKAATINALIAAVEAIETELGLLPSGIYASVRTRLDILEARIKGIGREIGSTILFSDSPYSVQISDDFIPVNSSGGPISIYLPFAPILGQAFTIADILNYASTHSVTILGNGYNINNAGTIGTSVVLSSNGFAITLLFNGTNWIKI